MHRTEPSRLQSLSLQLSDKIAQMVDNNERLLEFRGYQGGGGRGGWRGGDRGGGRGGWHGKLFLIFSFTCTKARWSTDQNSNVIL